MDWYADRNNKIYEAWLDGSPKRDIAARWNICIGRIDKIIAAMIAAEKQQAREVVRE